ncbi:sigma-70 family RNA polymerase sigma factor [Streptosporangiaceae bacterium NEAU-GS5]|nr:sigma-70 family RNA polymerase sigma factor [Streptosporangiaceae bacterium NEAU-GS5]
MSEQGSKETPDEDPGGPPEEARWLTELYDAHYGPLVGYIARRLSRGSLQEAEDIAQDVFRMALENRGRIVRDWRGDEPVWLYWKAKGQIPNDLRWFLRWRERWCRTVRREDIEPEPDHAPGVVSRTAVRRVLAAMSPEDRQVLQLYYWDDLATRDIGRILGINPNAVVQRLNRARRRFREGWAAGGGASGEGEA